MHFPIHWLILSQYPSIDIQTCFNPTNTISDDATIVQTIITNNLDVIYNWEFIIYSAVRSKSDTVTKLSHLDWMIFDIESFNLDQLKLFLKADLFQMDNRLIMLAIFSNKLAILQYCIDSGNNKLVILAISSNKLAILQYFIDLGVPLVDPSTEYEIRNTIEAAIEKKNTLDDCGPLLPDPYHLHRSSEFDTFPLVGFRIASQFCQSDDRWQDNARYTNYSSCAKDISICEDLVAFQKPNNNFTPEQLMKLYIISGNVSKFEDLLDSSDLLSTASDQFWSECWNQIGRGHHYPFAKNIQMLKLLLKNNIVGRRNYFCELAIDGEDFELIELVIRHNLVEYGRAFQAMDKCIQFNRQDLFPLLGQISELYESAVAFDKDHLWFWKQKIETKALTEDEVEYFKVNGLELGLEDIIDDMIGIGYFTWDELVEDLREWDEYGLCDFISETTVDILVRIREHSGELNLNAFDDGYYRTACESAILNGNLEVVKYILASDDFYGLESDRIIGMINHEFMMEYFFFECDIEYRASVHEKNYKLIRVACQKGHSTFIRRVIDELKPDVQFYNNLSPIYLAIQFGHLSIVQMIIEEAMKLGITDTLFDPNQSLIEVACIFNQHSVLEYILKLGKIDINANGGFALVSSCLEGSAECLQLLLNDPQCDISNLPANICTKMMKVNNNAECLRVLFNDGRFDWIDWKELLKQSCLFDNTPCVAYILENDIVDPNVDNQEAFQIAFTSGFYQIWIIEKHYSIHFPIHWLRFKGGTRSNREALQHSLSNSLVDARSFGLKVDNREALQHALSNSLVDSISVSFNTYSNLFQSYKYNQRDLQTLISSLNGTHDAKIVRSIIINNSDGIYDWESIICSAVRTKSDTVIQVVLDFCATDKPPLPDLDQKVFEIESFNLDQLKLFLKAGIFQIDSRLIRLAISSNKLAILQYCIDSGVPLVGPSTMYRLENGIKVAIKVALKKHYIELLRYAIQQPGLSDSSTKELLTNAAVVYCPDILGDLWKAGLLLLPRQYNFNSPYEFEPFPLVGYRTVSQIYQQDNSCYTNSSSCAKDISICEDLVTLQYPNNNFTPEQLMKLYIISGNHSKFEDLLHSSDILSTGSDQFWSECWDQIARYHHYRDANNLHMLKLLLQNNIVGRENYLCGLATDGEDFELIELLIRHNLVGNEKAFQTMDKCIRLNRQDLIPFLFKITLLPSWFINKDHSWFWKQRIETKALTEDEVEYFRQNGLKHGLEEIIDDMVRVGYFTWDELVEDLKDSDGWWICDFISETTVDILVRIREHSGELNLNAFDDGYYRTACESAILNGNLEVVKYILASDDFYGLESDRIIGMINHEFMMEFFFFECDIEYRASVHEKNYKLMRVACKKGHSAFIRRVIDELKPDVFYNNIAPIYLAIQNGHLSIVQMIIEEAMKLGITDTLFDPNQSLIEVACVLNQYDILEYILKLGKIDINANDGFALVSSCLKGSADCLQLLLNDPQCDISNLPATICTKMMKVTNAECLKVLFNDGRFDWIDWKELLKQSCLLGNTSYVAYMLENDIVDPNVDNQEAFQIAFTSGFYRIVTLFLNHPKFTITSIPNQ
ncbi:hypothetical protein HDV02_000944 [Globomyces sp. JEL0801]|nr:hypothetical protein HDV02_000944 [Globomyces sp. JEL0801]